MHRQFTSTAFVIDSQQRTLLLWHKRLERWMPPGGHVDPDELPEETVRRECLEETGLDVEIIGLQQENMFSCNPAEGRMLKAPIALLLEEIPESLTRKEGAHQHIDFVYLARPIDESQVLHLEKKEGSDIRWFTKEEVAALNSEREIFANVKAYILSFLQDDEASG